MLRNDGQFLTSNVIVANNSLLDSLDSLADDDSDDEPLEVEIDDSLELLSLLDESDDSDCELSDDSDWLDEDSLDVEIDDVLWLESDDEWLELLSLDSLDVELSDWLDRLCDDDWEDVDVLDADTELGLEDDSSSSSWTLKMTGN